MNILFLSAEVAPFSTVGGLSQVSYFLPRALLKLGHDVRIFSAKYGVIDGSGAAMLFLAGPLIGLYFLGALVSHKR